MGQITKKQSFERDETDGGGIVNQTCEYNSIAEWVTLRHIDPRGKEQVFSLPVIEFQMLLLIVNEAFEVKGGSL